MNWFRNLLNWIATWFPSRRAKTLNGFRFGIYQHYKGNLYWAQMLATHTETEETLVIYTDLSNGRAFARPLTMWVEEVDCPDGLRRPRFKFKRHVLA